MLMKLLKVMKVAGPAIVIPLAKKVFTELEPKMIYSVGVNSRPQQRVIAKYFKINVSETFGTTDKNGQSDVDIVPSDFPQQPLSVYKLMDGIVMRFRVHIHQTHTYERCFMYVECLNIQSHREKLDKFIHESYRAADRDMSDIYNEKNGTTKIFFTGNPFFKYRKLRSFDDVFIKDETEKEIKDNLDNFTNSRDWYREHNIPYHFGIMLYGPPGTGKSQTITNLIANALAQDKRVLFVAEKMAALNVVQKRLAKIGLDPFCLEMHSNKVTKRHVLDQLAKAIGVTHIVSPEEYAATAEKLYAERTKLIEYMEALHENKDKNGFSLYDCIQGYESKNCETWKENILTDELFQQFRKETLDDFEHLLGGRFESVMKLVGQPSGHALLGMDLKEEDLANESIMHSSLQEAVSILEAAITSLPTLSGTKEMHEAILRDNSEALFAQDADALHREWMEIGAKWFLPRFFSKRSFLKKMRTFSPYIIEANVDKVIDQLAVYTKQHKQICQVHSIIDKYFNIIFEDDVLPSKSELEGMVSRLNQWDGNLSGSRDWYQWCVLRKELADKGLTVLIDIIEKNEVNVKKVQDVTMKSIFMALAKKKIGESALLRTFEGMIFDETVERYKQLTADFQLLSQKALYAKLASQIPHVTDNINSGSEIGLLNRNISNGGRGLSLRDLMDQLPNLMLRLCPCMLMSPMSVAQYLSLSQEKFDLVIFDEASQMPTSEAIGAIARGKALIVVGDPKQMPPTSFFSSSNVDEDEAELDDMESILEDCRTLEIPSLQLNWHYRSKHESLIAFSNHEYYDGSLITFPSVDDQSTKVQYIPVSGYYDKGGKRSNAIRDDAVRNERTDSIVNEQIHVLIFPFSFFL